MLHRREFLASAIAAIGAFSLDPERLLWVPGQKKIFVPVALPEDPFAPLWKDEPIVLKSTSLIEVGYGPAIRYRWESTRNSGWFENQYSLSRIPEHRERCRQLMAAGWGNQKQFDGVSLAI